MATTHDYPDLLVQMGNDLAKILIERQFCSQEQADILVLDLLEKVRLEWRGQRIYFKKLTCYKLIKRDKDILRDYEKGINTIALAAKYNVERRQVYKILAASRVRRERKRAKQEPRKNVNKL